MDKSEIIKQLNISFDKLFHWLERQDDYKFSEVKWENKWTSGQHVEHLLMSTTPVTKAMKMPKLLMRYSFGICNRPERTFDELVTKYELKLEAAVSTTNPKYAPRFVSAREKKDVLQALDLARHNLISVSNKWIEKDLSKYVIPHPLLGKLTVREMLYFTVLHTDHHRAILKDRY